MQPSKQLVIGANLMKLCDHPLAAFGTSTLHKDATALFILNGSAKT
jgi:hypothetical protein